MLIAQWQDAVTRRDMAEAFSFEDFKEVTIKNYMLVVFLIQSLHGGYAGVLATRMFVLKEPEG